MQKQEEIKNQKRGLLSFVVRIFFWEAFLFSSVLLLGIFTAFKMSSLIKGQETFVQQPSPLWFILYFFLATLFIFILSLLRKFRRAKGLIFKFLIVFTSFFGGLILLSSLGVPDIFALAIMTILILAWLKISSVLIHDLVIILGLAGAGGVLGLNFKPQTVVMFLAIFSIYDFIAVYITKHMVKMAKDMIEAGTVLGLVIPQQPSDFKTDLKEVSPGGRFLILGGGDVVFPLILCSSLISQGIIQSLIVALFSLIGLFASFCLFVSQKNRRPIPALPPIALFAIIGFLVTRILW